METTPLSNPKGASEEGDGDEVLPAGTAFGQYSIEACIGRGGMGVVYSARHRGLQKRVALKTLHPSVARDGRARQRFLHEGIAASRLRHPHVVDVVDHGIQDGTPFLVMEYLEGESLAAEVERGALPVERAVEVMLPVCAATAAAHDEGIVHRDLKPANIFVARDRLGREQVKVLDFGVSKTDGLEAGGLTPSAALLGTPWYMSPEQAQDSSSVGPASDQYALGVILAECVTGRRPFEARALYAVLRDIVAGAMTPPRAHRPELPEAFERVILRATRVSEGERYPSVIDLARALLPFAAPPVRAAWEGVFRESAPPTGAPASAPPRASSPGLDATAGGTTAGGGTAPSRAKTDAVATIDTPAPTTVTPRPTTARRAWLAPAATLLALAGLVTAWVWLAPRGTHRTPEPASSGAPEVSARVAPTEPPRPTPAPPAPPELEAPERRTAEPAAPAPAARPAMVRARVPTTPTPRAAPRPQPLRQVAAPARPAVVERQRGANGAPIEE